MRRRLLAIVLVTACGGSVDGPLAGDAALPDGGGNLDPGVERFIGRLAASPTVPFGGAPYCNYTVTMQNVVLDVTVHPVHGLTSMVIRNDMVEALAATCSNPPLGTKPQVFEYRGGALPAGTDGSFAPMLVGLPANQPQTAATVRLTRPQETQLVTPLRWVRTDLTGQLGWTVDAAMPIALDRVPCEQGGIYCIGSATTGTLYGCSDGTHLTQVKVCPAGCASSMPPTTPHVNETCN